MRFEQIGQPRNDCKAQPKSPVAFVHRARLPPLAQLHELAKHILTSVVGDAAAGIPDRDTQPVATAPTTDQDAAALRVANRIRDQVLQRLLQAIRIGSLLTHALVACTRSVMPFARASGAN